MRIIHVGELNFEQATGSGMAVWSLVTGLRGLGCEIEVLRPFGEPSERERTRLGEVEITMSVLAHNRRAAWLSARARGRQIAEMRPDLVHFHSGFLPLHSRLAAALASHGIPYVITPHGCFHPGVLRRSPLKKAAYLQLIERGHLRRAAALIALTEGERRELQALAPGQRVEVIPNALDAETLRLCEAARAVRQPQPGALRGLFLGRYDVWHKGLDFLFALTTMLQERGVNIEMCLYGTEDAHAGRRREFQRLAAQCPPYIHIHSAVYGEAKVAALAEADVYFQSSRYEAFSISVAEAMAAGLPVVITDLAHLSSTVREAGAGTVIPFDVEKAAALLLDALADRAALRQAGERGRQYVMQHFTFGNVAGRTLELYRSIVQRAKSSAGGA